jgi:UDP-glucose 4-epimerase
MTLTLVTGACGFVGRNLVKRLLATTDHCIVMVDDLSVGTAAHTWLPQEYAGDLEGSGKKQRLLNLVLDARDFFRGFDSTYKAQVEAAFGPFVHWDYVYHFAAIVGGRAKIDGDPMMVALDLSIDAEFFYWITRQPCKRCMFPSSSAAYPISLQREQGAIALRESDIDFSDMGKPDMTYGWSKLTGEFLAQIAAKHYGISVACVRPFSGYGEDQDLSYPVPAIAARAARMENPFEVWGTGFQGRDFVHIDDCIDAIIMATEQISDGSAINIGSGKLTTFRDLIQLFSSFAGYQPEIKALVDKPVGVHSRYSNIDYVKQRLDWAPKVSLEEGMRRVYEAAKKHTAA